MDTIQNACYSVRIMQDTAGIRPRSFPAQFTCPAPAYLQPSALSSGAHTPPPRFHPSLRLTKPAVSTVETLKTVRYLVWARWADACEPELNPACPRCPLSAWSCKLVMMRFPVRIFSSSLPSRVWLWPAESPHRPRACLPRLAQTATTNGTYVAVDPLAKVRYDNRYDALAGPGLRPHEGRPTLLQGSNLGGLDLSGSFWLSQHWAIEGYGPRLCGHQRRRRRTTLRNIKGPFVSQYFFTGGPEWLGPAQQARRADCPCPGRRSLRQFRAGSAAAIRPRWSISTTTSSRRPPSSAATGPEPVRALGLPHHARRLMTRYSINYPPNNHPDRCQLRHLRRRRVQVQEEALTIESGTQTKDRASQARNLIVARKWSCRFSPGCKSLLVSWLRRLRPNLRCEHSAS